MTSEIENERIIRFSLFQPLCECSLYPLLRGPTIGQVAEVVNQAIPGARISAENGPYLHGGQIPCAKKGALDISRAQVELGYESRYDIRRGIEMTIDATRLDLQQRAVEKVSAG